MKSFVYYKQAHDMDCGPTCLKMIAAHFDRDINPHQIENITEIRKNGTSLLDLCIAAKKIGLNAAGIEINLRLLRRILLPIILHWNNHHFVVLFKIKKGKYYIADPLIGIMKISESELMNNWQTSLPNNTKKRVVLLFSKKRNFYIK